LLGDLSLKDVLKYRYSYPRIQWLIGVISAIATLYLTSEEIWTVADGEPFPEVSVEGIACYSILFLAGLVITHYVDAKRITDNCLVAFVASIFSIAFDLLLISSAELAVLCVLQVTPQSILGTVTILILGALPASLGSIVLSSLTSDVLRKKARDLLERAKTLSKQIEDSEARIGALEDIVKADEKRLKEFKKQRGE